MGILSKLITGKVAATAINRHLAKREAARMAGEYIPASMPAAAANARTYGGALADRAGQVYKQNPKLVTTIASGALLVAAAAFAKRKGYM
ncbi:MAG TPA: hypothetical protein VM073_12500 [Usitatibacter sp.]|nr:hypothetical protein [Usitatibacter sp.]